jgi:hydroxypyruvate isomerase
MFTLAACAEMLFRDLPIEARVRRIAELGFAVEIWDWTRHDIGVLERTGATFSSMTGYVTGDLVDPNGVDELLHTAAQSIPVAKRLGIPRLNLHGRHGARRPRPAGAADPHRDRCHVAQGTRHARPPGRAGARHGVMFVLENLKMPKSTIRAYHSAVPPIAWP